ncbi:Lipid A-core:surface polymer ligase WaaL, partial [human gut metagenome]
DVISYATKNNSQSSVGARFAMVNAGIKGSPDGFNWQSLEQRAEKIKALSAENNMTIIISGNVKIAARVPVIITAAKLKAKL